MLSLIFGLTAAVLSLLGTYLGVPYAGLVSMALGVAAWIAGEKALKKNGSDRLAYYGRLIGMISTIIACLRVGISIYLLTHGAPLS